jgi:hypothetical protein
MNLEEQNVKTRTGSSWLTIESTGEAQYFTLTGARCAPNSDVRMICTLMALALPEKADIPFNDKRTPCLSLNLKFHYCVYNNFLSDIRISGKHAPVDELFSNAV